MLLGRFKKWAGCKRFWAGIFLCLFLVCAAPVSAESSTLIYFYNPDANLRDIARLRAEMQGYFRSVDASVQLKTFLRLHDLLKALKSQPPDFLLASSWVINDYTAQYNLKPLLVGKKNGVKSYNKVLISKRNLPGEGSPSLSMVGLGEKGSSQIKDLVPALKKFSNLELVEVSKDIDAVLAVSFDQVDMALVRQQNIDAIRSVNSTAVANIKVLAKSAPIEYPVFSASSTAGPELVQKFVDAMKQTPGKMPSQAMELLGFDGWAPR